MPSFLSRVFGRKKADDKASKRVSNGSLLEGKFEAVSATPSPSATNFVEAAQARERERASQKDKEKEKDAGFTLFRSRSRPTSPPLTAQKKPSDVPHLSLNLPKPKEERSRALGVVFEADPDALTILDDAVIGGRRLTPLETLVLVRACSQVIVERGAFCILPITVSSLTYPTRSGNPGNHAPALVLLFSGGAAQTYLSLHTLFGSQKLYNHAHSYFRGFCLRI